MSDDSGRERPPSEPVDRYAGWLVGDLSDAERHAEIERRRVLDLHDPAALAALVAGNPTAATRPMLGWRDHPLGVSPLSYVAMARYDTGSGRWRDVARTGACAQVLLDAGAPVDGDAGDPETPLMTAASYGDADVARVLIAAGARLDDLAAPSAGGVPGGSALLHAAVFGMTDALDVLVAAGARIRSIEEGAAAGELAGWLRPDVPVQARLRALVMAADHQRLDAMRALVAAGAPLDEADEVFGRHPLRLAAANGRAASVELLLSLGADPRAADADGRTALDLCRAGRADAIDPSGHDAVESILLAATAR